MSARPAPMIRPCGTCSKGVDVLRAGILAGAEFADKRTARAMLIPFCDEKCRRGYVHEAALEPANELPRAIGASLVPPRPTFYVAERRAAPHEDKRARASSVLGLMVFMATLLAIVAPDSFGARVATGALCVLAAAFSVRIETRKPWFLRAQVLTQSLAVAAAAVAGIYASSTDGAYHALLACAVMAGATVMQPWLAAWMERPWRQMAERSLLELPEYVREVKAAGVFSRARSNEDSFVAVRDLRAGDRFAVSEGEVVGCDGEVVSGEALAVTWPLAPFPTQVRVGNHLATGSVIVEGSLVVRATTAGPDSLLRRATAELRPQRDRQSGLLLDALAIVERYGWLAFVFAGLAAGPWAQPPWQNQVLTACAVVAIASLPLLVVTVRSLLTTARIVATYRGIYFVTPRSIELAGTTDIVVLAMRGVVADRAVETTEYRTLDDSDANALLALALAAETVAPTNAFGASIRAYAEAKGIKPAVIRHAKSEPGRGVVAVTVEGEPFVFGNRQLLLSEGVSIALAEQESERAESKGQTALFMSLSGRTRAVATFASRLRSGVRAAVQALRDQRIDVLVVSGDNLATVQSLCGQVDITNAKAELSPDERGQEVKQLRGAGMVVASIGLLGPHDAQLQAATLPIYLSGAGAEKVVHGVALASDKLRDAALAFALARTAFTQARVLLVTGVSCTIALAGLAALDLIEPTTAVLCSLGLEFGFLLFGQRVHRRLEGLAIR